MKMLLKISVLAIVILMVGGLSFAEDILSPAIFVYTNTAVTPTISCIVRNVSNAPIDVSIELCDYDSCQPPADFGFYPISLDPGYAASYSGSGRTGQFWCNFVVPKSKDVKTSVCSTNGCIPAN